MRKKKVTEKQLSKLNVRAGQCKTIEDHSGLIEDIEQNYIQGNSIKKLLPVLYNYRGALYYRQGKLKQAFDDINKAIELDPQCTATIYNNRGNLYYDQGNLEHALVDYNKAIELDPKYANAYNGRGNSYKDQSNPEETLADYNKAIELDPKHRYAYNNRGKWYQEQGQYKEALADYNKAIELDPNDTKAYNNRGNVYYDQGNSEEALADYNKAIELDPKCAGFHYNRGCLYGDQGNSEQALADYNKAIELDPKGPAAYYNRGLLYYDEGNLEQALADYNKVIELDPEGLAGYNSRGLLYYDQGNLAEALADYNKVIELDPKDTNAYNGRGTLYLDQGNSEQALTDYNKAIELDPNNVEAYYNRGFLYNDQGNLEQALADYDKAIELDPNNAKAYYNRGNWYKDQGKPEQALTNYNKAIELNPKDAGTYNNRGNWYKDQGKPEQALTDYNKAIKLSPKSARIYSNRGSLYDGQGKPEQALADYDKAIELDPNNAIAHLNRGNWYKDQGNSEQALEDFNKARSLELSEDQRALLELHLFRCLFRLDRQGEAEEQLTNCFRRWLTLLNTSQKGLKNNKKQGFNKELREHLKTKAKAGSDAIQYLRAHYFLVNEIFSFLLGQRLEQGQALHSMRLKRLESIVDKLERFPTMQVNSIQDIAGNRVILETQEELDRFAAELRDNKLAYFESDDKHSKNYIKEPKDDGYRSLHLIFRFNLDAVATDCIFAPFRVELQLRTKYQHYWATAVEVIDTFHGSRLKQGEEQDEWSKFFQEAGEHIAALERAETSSFPAGYEDRLAKLRNIQDKAKITGSKIQSQRYYLIEVKGSQVDVQTYPDKEKEKAYKHYEKLEHEAQQGKKESYSVFLTSGQSLNQLKELYPNYFADTKNFVSLLQRNTVP
ncbi:tetratricopeptide repeat protein [Candidatus Haliotispira prima]|uniref:Tetratricopeptide repeat protein n=1 Tax=Candidatus Haliotispira prima TaxID=3034016 RepID=A0ABY8MEJ8_9SPIO|nr:tetratricopeptide repeat protein [Candidatus Haliotispira prima]